MIAWILSKVGLSGLQFMTMFVAIAVTGAACFAWGDSHAAGAAIAAATKAAADQVAEVKRGYEAQITTYDGKLKSANQAANQLSDDLAKVRAALVLATASAKQQVPNVVPANPSCDLTPGAIDLLRQQSARH